MDNHNHILEIPTCFICLQSCSESQEHYLQCCLNFLHKSCFLSLIITNHDACPLCRKQINIDTLFADGHGFTKFIDYKKNVCPELLSRYRRNYYSLLYHVSPYKYKLCSLKMKSLKLTLYHYKRDIIQIVGLFILLSILLISAYYVETYIQDTLNFRS